MTPNMESLPLRAWHWDFNELHFLPGFLFFFLSLSLEDGSMKGRIKELLLKQLGLAYFLSSDPLLCCLRERTFLPLSAQL